MMLDQRGLTLAEILVAVAIIGVGLLGLLVVVPVSSYSVQEGKQLSTATFLAEQRLEQVRNAAWTVVPAMDCLGASPGGANPNGEPTSNACTRPSVPPAPACNAGVACTTFADETPVPGFAGYSRTTRIQDCSAGAGCGVGPNAVASPTMRLVTVTVTYTPMTGQGGVVGGPKSAHVSWVVARK